MAIPSLDPPAIPLILGGHSFIRQVGNDPAASEDQQLRIVESCLDHGIRWIDTTYQPERIALGQILEKLGRRSEATILAWNFFTAFGPTGEVGTAREYQPTDIDRILGELRTSYVDHLVLCLVDDPERRHHQEELLSGWRKQGYVRSLGLWVPDADAIRHYRETDVFQFAVRPFNITTADEAPLLATCKLPGRELVATSPFFRGWELDRLVRVATSHGMGEPTELRATLADRMLRFSMFASGADRLIIAMRKLEWVQRNIASLAKGPLTAEEFDWLTQLRTLGARKVWWQRAMGALTGRRGA